MSEPLTIYLIAGEVSGDFLGGQLMAAIKQQSARPVKFYGVGGERMEAEGLASLFPYHELAMLGFLEVLPHLFRIFAHINAVVEDVLAKRPDVVLTIDSPGFCSRVVERLRKENIRTKFIHYVAPTVWAYKPRRALQCVRIFDHLLVLLPFEPPYFEKVGLPCTFVGHPVVAETAPGDGAAFRAKYEIPADATLFCLLPGSRKGEIKRMMPVFAGAITLLAARYPKLAMAVAVPRHVLPFIAPYFAGCPFRAVITANAEDRKNAIAAADAALVKSGTVALEVALARIPMIVAYKVNWLSALILKRIGLMRFVNIVNIVEDREIIPELLQENCTPERVADVIDGLLKDPQRRREQAEASRLALSKLLPPACERPSDVAARTVLRLIFPGK